MNPQTLFLLIIGLLVVNYLFDLLLGYLNAKRFGNKPPSALADLYDPEEYQKSQEYKRVTYRFGLLSGGVSFAATLIFFLVDGFAWVDALARSWSDHEIVVALLFFGIILTASSILSLPFSYYRTFVIEERFGFNKTTLKTFVLDKIKGAFIGALIGGGLLALLIWIYQQTGANFWWYAWAVITGFSVLMNFFYTRLIVPLFNKQTPLEEGPLKDRLEAYAQTVGFTLSKIMVIDGSKRSTRANAYFSGFGRQKQVTLYDTLIDDLEEDEVVAVLAHEIGHYKCNHIPINLVLGIVTTGLTLFIFSLLIDNPLLSEALGVGQPSFHLGLIAFGILYSPLSEITGLLMNYLSRVFEFQADAYAVKTFKALPLVNGLKKLAKKNLSNLSPHPAYVFVHYSHPPLDQRINAMLNPQ
ncbi:M48 family metallopeptidase [Gilvibacter sediminis]|uniref:M48 family metallopeptidase n=1 Tax=Gilvibacter sediminis TaxID=379071 RepID=UPI002350E48B|nr:M48 family metallopeptidase [Gilvibacter sediminis]MDC7998890.1 M48 family metallopeptidase [Gilvibacter sediminis]